MTTTKRCSNSLNDREARRYSRNSIANSRFLSLQISLAIFLLISATPVHAEDNRELLAGDFVRSSSAEYPVLPSRRNVIRLALKNPYDRPANLLISIYFDVEPTLQYSREVLLQPKTQTAVWLPVMLPPTKPPAEGYDAKLHYKNLIVTIYSSVVTSAFCARFRR